MKERWMTGMDFIAWLHELLDPLGCVATRAMFGGHGMYLDGIIVGIIVDDQLYLKTDAVSQPQFAAAGCAPFVYINKDGPMPMSYWSVPDEAMDASEAMAPWARLALAAAQRKAAAKAPGTAKSAKKEKATKAAKSAKSTKPTSLRKAT
jgi:DNA transformation protein